MTALLDTHVLVWALAEPERLPRRLATRLLGDETKVFSPVSILEAAIKYSLGRADFRLSPEELIAFAREAALSECALTSSAAARVAHLPFHHRDPFDRLLVAQAIDADAVLLTSDARLAPYGSHVQVFG